MQNQHDEWGWKISVVVLLSLALGGLSACAARQSFSSPEAGMTALVEAVKLNDQPSIRAILGPRGNELISSGDRVADEHNREAFIAAYHDAHKLVLDDDRQAMLVVGQNEWPMPIPLVKSSAGWQFDTPKGEQEIFNRRIGRNELAAIQVCLSIVDAAHEYAALDLDGDGIPEYAPQFVSTPGTRDGLYWPTKPGEPPSPLGPLLAAATSEGYSVSTPLAPYHGYFYKILTKQGNDAPGGDHDYVIKGHMMGGFALIAYPARHGVSGVMSFLVNQEGAVYEQNLGEHTTAIASKMTTFNPDASWRQVPLLAKARSR